MFTCIVIDFMVFFLFFYGFAVFVVVVRSFVFVGRVVFGGGGWRSVEGAYFYVYRCSITIFFISRAE